MCQRDPVTEILERVPSPDVVRRWRAAAVHRAELLDRLLRLAERKAAAEQRRIAKEGRGPK